MADQEQAKPGQSPEAGTPVGGGDFPTGTAPKSAAEALAAEALRAAQQAIAGINSPSTTDAAATASSDETKSTAGAPAAATPQPFTPPLINSSAGAEGSQGIDLLSDVDLEVKIELGRTRMFVEDVLRLREGAVVELDKLAGDPVDVYVNDRPVARGEVLILNDNFCVRINEILASVTQEG